MEFMGISATASCVGAAAVAVAMAELGQEERWVTFPGKRPRHVM